MVGDSSHIAPHKRSSLGTARQLDPKTLRYWQEMQQAASDAPLWKSSSKETIRPTGDQGPVSLAPRRQFRCERVRLIQAGAGSQQRVGISCDGPRHRFQGSCQGQAQSQEPQGASEFWQPTRCVLVYSYVILCPLRPDETHSSELPLCLSPSNATDLLPR